MGWSEPGSVSPTDWAQTCDLGYQLPVNVPRQSQILQPSAVVTFWSPCGSLVILLQLLQCLL